LTAAGIEQVISD